MPDLYERLGLPTDLDEARTRMGERFEELSRRDPVLYGDPLERLQRTDRWYEELGDRTGVPTYHDIFAALRGEPERLREWIDDSTPDLEHDPPPDTGEQEEDDEEDEDDGDAWWWVVGGGVGWLVHKLMESDVEQPFDFEFDLPAWEIDGIPWTTERTRVPGPPFAARVADPLLHGGAAVPGPGSIDVKIGGRPALTVEHVVGACPMPNVLGLPHLPHAGSTAWTTTNTVVRVNGQPLLRAGDWVMETLGGPNPIVAGAPLVLAGPPAAPCVVWEVTRKGLDELVPGLQRIGSPGGTVSLKGTVSWNAWEMVKTTGLGLLHAGGGPVGAAVARALMTQVEGPKVEVSFEASMDWYTDWLAELDFDGDGEIDHLVESRVSGETKASSKHAVELDPTNPTKAKDETEGELEFESDVKRPEVQTRKPGEARKPWKDEKNE